MKKEEELKIRISPADKERIRFKMEEAGILNMSADVRKMARDCLESSQISSRRRCRSSMSAA